jgi:hypothetical protein
LKYKDTTISTHETVDADHGRIETAQDLKTPSNSRRRS